MPAASFAQRARKADIAPLEDLEPNTAYEGDWKLDGGEQELPRLFAGRVEFERADGEWRGLGVEKCGAKMDPLGIDPDATRWSGRGKTWVDTVHLRPREPMMTPEAVREPQSD